MEITWEGKATTPIISVSATAFAEAEREGSKLPPVIITTLAGGTRTSYSVRRIRATTTVSESDLPGSRGAELSGGSGTSSPGSMREKPASTILFDLGLREPTANATDSNNTLPLGAG
ncbi:hypothetical protein TWF506_008017 [Arthrobotrys conoides]|uniref:Uncharacterized protein n=1 Tax=Arthrobotrys conoides TaxID=74498 RepID=A0AAN8NML6_9PEZI